MRPAATRSGKRARKGQTQQGHRNPYFARLRQVVELEREERGSVPDLTVEQVLTWADAHRTRTGVWPTPDSGCVTDAAGESWLGIEAALFLGLRGLPGGFTLPRLLQEHRGRRNNAALPPFTPEQILGWANAHHRRTGEWPKCDSGPVADAPRETWTAVNVALTQGLRGLPGGSSLAQLLATECGVRNRMQLPPLTPEKILGWADAHYRSAGKWPTNSLGPIADAPGETWSGVDAALYAGARGLPGGSSLAQLLAAERGARHLGQLPSLTPDGILAWADAHHRRTGKWPTGKSGPIAEAPGETWCGVDMALRVGVRGLPGGSSLARLLAAERGARHQYQLTPLTPEGILAWADAHYRRTGEWPTSKSGPVDDAPGETWNGVSVALYQGRRGLPGGSSLARLLAEWRGVPNRGERPRLRIEAILAWADAHFQRSGAWPKAASGPIADAPGETWTGVDMALRVGVRGLPGGTSLAQLLAAERGVRHQRQQPPFTPEAILAWADAHYRRTGRWPTLQSGPIPEAPGETWAAVAAALRQGHRGLPGGGSLPQLLRQRRLPAASG